MELFENDALSLSSKINRGKLSAVELMDATLDRIDAVNDTVNAIVYLEDRDKLLAQAKAADASKQTGWLRGVPIAVKDLANVEGMPTTMGSPLFVDTIAPRDDLLVERMKAAGAIIIGKTNTPEFGLGSHTTNSVFGPTRNPYDQSKSAGGSSGGAATALAARMLSVADGSDMMGSLRNPAGWNNVYGMRPTWGAVPSEPTGDVFMHQLATSGPMARSPADLAALIDTMTSPDPRQPNSHFPGVATPMLALPVEKQRIAWLGDWGGAYPYEDGIAELSEAALKQMEDMGHHVEAVKAPFDAESLWESWITLRSFAVAGGAHPLYADPAKRAQLKATAQWEIERGISMTAMDLLTASMTRSDWFRRTLELFDNYDVLVLPSAQCWPFDVNLEYPTEIAGVTMDTYHRWMQVVVPASLIGLPVVNIPAGFGANGLPGGLQLIGPRSRGGRLLQLAHEWHTATDWPNKRPPDL
ncbi:Amidase [Sulfitobacter noctilucicola]|uniref:Amidase n=1 Tax=Sulfitobacter noctilucicola TaxID=1342301 RepID=A0A7W6MB13_9RHOB|nr:amidase [Sulfitobacter noctilucicola]KIN66407.1 Amidase [Sulfitobacter noctilucicola]MBB4175755.1 amidase [Sulfitobacter noctilucicola]